MQTVIEAVFENGLLRPLSAATLEEHQRYRLIVEDAPKPVVTRKISSAPNRSREYEWLREHRHEYAGQYVALAGHQLLAHGTDGRTVLAEAEATGEPLPYIVRVEDADETAFWGGWL